MLFQWTWVKFVICITKRGKEIEYEMASKVSSKGPDSDME